MIPELRKLFNERYSPDRYHRQQEILAKTLGSPIGFRLAETPLFLSHDLAVRASELAVQILKESVSPRLQAIGAQAVPLEFNVAGETAHPHFAAIDFAITGSPDAPELKLIELQGFPSLFYFQSLYTRVMRDLYEFDDALTGLLAGYDSYESYYDALRDVILGNEDPAHVILLELDPFEQKTLPDFLLTRQQLGLQIVNIRDLVLENERMFYRTTHGLEEVRRVYNRTIYDELRAKQVEPQPELFQPLDVTWAGHPNWYYRISKILLPHLTSAAVPKGYLLSNLPFAPHDIDLSDVVLKPLFSFAGSGVVVGPEREDLERVPQDQRDKWMLQERVQYADVIRTPDGNGVKAELRVMMLWPENDEPRAAHTLVRLTRGKMVGVDYNKGLDFVGSSVALIPPA